MKRNPPISAGPSPASGKHPATLRIAQWATADPATLETRRAKRLLRVGRTIAIVLTVALLGLLGRVVQLQARPSQPIAEMRNTQTSTATLPAMRGALTDRSGRVLAATRVSYRMFCDPLFIENRATFIETIAYELGYSPEEMIEMEIKMSGRSGSRYVLLDPRMTDEQVDRFHEADIKGIYLEPVVVRDYPQGGIAGTLIGFVGSEGDGLEGLERHWEERLGATPGHYKYLRDSRRRAMWLESETYVPYEDGENIRLSIDAVIQGIAERELAKAVEAHTPDQDPSDEDYYETTGQLIVMQPHTGEILAIATYPSYDPSDFQAVEDAQRRNRPITDVFEPGSIFKPFIWAGLTEMGAARPEELIDTTTTRAWIMPNGRRLEDASAHGLCSWHDVLVYSSNIGMAKIALRRDIHDIFDIMSSFGFGQRTGVDLPGEVVGLMRMHDNAGAQNYSHGSWPMGQEIGTTGMQLVRAMSMIANGGVMVTPRIEAINPYDESYNGVKPQRVVSQRVAQLTLDAMRDAVATDHGTGRHANSPYYDIFGKTGTAQLPDPNGRGYMADGFASSFLGGAPADSPRLVVGCFVIGTKRASGHYGGLVSAPAVRNVLEQSLVYLGVPTNPGTDPAEIMVPDELDAE
ncbi:MAG: peptidoglycan D,D-transpeptidase FtsI family protein [Phycisphaerales bacterium JB063]